MVAGRSFFERVYRFFRNILFLFPPEFVHYFSMNFLRLFCAPRFIRKEISKYCTPRGDHRFRLFRLEFPNRIGLGAGFDKNARYLRELECLGFGFVEIGTVTPVAQAGNPKPRLFRLPDDRALINRMGFNNDGVDVIAERLKVWRQENAGSKLIIGGNIGKNKDTPNEEAWKDYEACFKKLHPFVDYFVVNVSSPNTPGLRELQEKESLRKILVHLHMINNGKAHAKPILLKIAPDLSQEQVDDVVDLALEIKLDGLVVSNTTVNRAGLKIDNEKLGRMGSGGLSGAPLREKSTEIVKYICQRAGEHLPVIASGGVFDTTAAQEKFLAGARLVQVWTGFDYEGPAIVRKIYKNQ
jgi:dihydroorotate dehydrogenase